MMLSIIKNKKIKSTLQGVAVAAIWLAAWQWIAWAVGKEVLLASPLSVAIRLVELVREPGFWLSVGTSLVRVMSGFVLGVVLGVLLAFAMHRFAFVRALFSPIIGIVKATPVASFMILALLWLSTGAVPGFCAAVMVLPVLCGNVLEGLEQIDPQLSEMVSLFGMGRWRRLWNLTLPSVMPYFMAGAKTCIGLSWKAGIAAEVLCTPLGSLGKNLYESKIYLDTPSMFAWTAVIVLTSILLEKGFVLLMNRFSRRRGDLAAERRKAP